ncbi:MAG: EcoRII N-terminal effector-binding domain-containing protein [Janthinobacterium svalbardensis]
MTKKTFTKILSANDVGKTGAHQGGVLIPKTEAELLSILPSLDPAIKNPDAWIECLDEIGVTRRFRFVYYNNKLHDEKGTRNEYRLTYMTRYFRDLAANEGDTFEISGGKDKFNYNIRIVRPLAEPVEQEEEKFIRIKITSSWRRVH